MLHLYNSAQLFCITSYAYAFGLTLPPLAAHTEWMTSECSDWQLLLPQSLRVDFQIMFSSHLNLYFTWDCSRSSSLICLPASVGRSAVHWVATQKSPWSEVWSTSRRVSSSRCSKVSGCSDINSLGQRFSTCGPQTTSGPRPSALWSSSKA